MALLRLNFKGENKMDKYKTNCPDRYCPTIAMLVVSLVLSLVLCSCAFFKPVNPTVDLECYYESIKYGQGNWEQEWRIYQACVLTKGIE